ncbi:MAG: hypothetical protein ACXWID_14595 [Pyrinomonadaceae bacterium]
MSTALIRKLAILTDEDAEKCLNGLLHGLTLEKPEYARLLGSTEDIKKVVKAAADDKIQAERVEAITSEERSKAIRILLVELADHETFEIEMEAWIDGARETMLVPIAVPLVLAGIVLVLSIDIEIEYKNEDGKKKFGFKLKKSRTSEKILGKFFGLFG